MRLTHLLCLAALLAYLPGCNPKQEEFQPAAPSGEVKEAEPHVHTAPHGGELIELGNHEYNAELLLDKATKTITVYLHDAHAEKPQAIPDKEIVLHLSTDTTAEVEIKLPAVPLATDPEGSSSRFEAAGVLTDELAAADHLHGHVDVTIAGTPYSGELGHSHEGHEHGDHDHEEHKEEAATPPAPTE